MSINDTKYQGKHLVGTVYQLAGSQKSEDGYGNLYKVVARDIVFDDWNKQGLVLGEERFGISISISIEVSHQVRESFSCDHGFYLVIQDHKHWGLFLPEGTPTVCVERALHWLRLYGENPALDDNGPTTHPHPADA